MRLSREKINQLSHSVVQALLKDEHTEIFKDTNDIRLEVVNLITGELQIEEEIDTEVKNRLSSYKKKIVEGSQEWEILYQKTYEEEMKKKRR